eukprot:gene27598-34342_t
MQLEESIPLISVRAKYFNNPMVTIKVIDSLDATKVREVFTFPRQLDEHIDVITTIEIMQEMKLMGSLWNQEEHDFFPPIPIVMKRDEYYFVLNEECAKRHRMEEFSAQYRLEVGQPSPSDEEQSIVSNGDYQRVSTVRIMEPLVCYVAAEDATALCSETSVGFDLRSERDMVVG